MSLFNEITDPSCRLRLGLELLVIAEDDADFLVIEHRLRQECEGGCLSRAIDLASLETLLSQGNWDAVLAGFDQQGPLLRQALALVRRQNPDLPVILITGSIGEAAVVQLLREGVWDVVRKENLVHLGPVIERALRMADARRIGHEAESRYLGLVDGIGDAFFIHDSQGRFLAVNQQSCDSLGYDKTELLGMGVMDVETGVDTPAAQALWAAMTSGEVRTLEGRHRRKDGSEFPVEVRVRLLEVAGERRFIALVRDMTEHRAIEATLRHDREQQLVLRELLEEALAGGGMEETLRRCLKRLLEVSWLAILPKGGIFLREPSGGGLRLAVAINLSPEIRAACAQVPLGHCHCGRAAQQGQMQYVPCVDERHDIRYPGMTDHGHYAFPLISEEEVLGVLVLYLPIGFHPNPEKEQFLASVADILAGFICRKRQEEDLVRHRNHLEELVTERTAEIRRQSLIIDQVHDSVVTTDLDGFVIDWNQGAERLFGWTAADAMGKHIAFVYPPEEHDFLQHQVIEPLKREGTHETEVRMWRRDGSPFYGHLSLSLLYDEAGAPMGMAGYSLDITERKRAEEQLRIAAVAFDSHDGMLVTDANRIILQVNQAFTRITGYSAEEAIGQTPALLRSSRHDSAFYRTLWESIRHEGRWEGEIWNRRKDGGIIPEWLSITAIRDPSGAVTHYLGAFSNINEPREAQRKIIELAYYDPLTNLPNRRLLMDRLNHALLSGDRTGRIGALVLLDLDNFKTLNDSRGHDVGDQLLGEVAGRLQAALRESDTAARFGGDEFAVLLEGLAEDELAAASHAESIAEKLRAALSGPYGLRAGVYHGSASIGITLFQDNEIGMDALLKQADLALYEAKSAGRDCIRFFDAAMQAAVNTHIQVEEGLRRAIAGDELFLVYQPQIEGEGRVTGAEALLRWQPPTGPLVSPVTFIPVAEESGLILPIGQWVLTTACRQLAAWSRNPATRNLRLSVNVSARQFRQADFVEQVWTVLGETGAPASRLELELTESLVLKDVEKVIDTMKRLKAMGVRFSLDDFGTGYSSLAYLKRLPLDQLKIDQGFVRSLPDAAENAAIVKAIIALGQSLGLEVIAEGVETEPQRQFLAQAGCLNYQGYLFARPGPAEGVEAMARAVKRD
ncbi:MAG: EAL domain-containing protein [Gammaproteobacteria bacterium]|nr:EAL domain-containing protein [Gammaproteobacteria bacterium]MBU1653630.1 EAL domain-containing protein [Gammaproteobacteria bacterium]MBU1960669.1 EAL domain-containing protein [Gammaproteobacteria bacterium]